MFIQSPTALIFNTSAFSSPAVPNFIILANGCVGIATTNPATIFQVGNGGRLRISNGNTDYSLLGTLDIDGTTNTRIVVSGNTRSGSSGNIEYLTTSTGSHIFYTNNGTERMRINSSGIGIGITNPFAMLNIGAPAIDGSDGTLVM